MGLGTRLLVVRNYWTKLPLCSTTCQGIASYQELMSGKHTLTCFQVFPREIWFVGRPCVHANMLPMNNTVQWTCAWLAAMQVLAVSIKFFSTRYRGNKNESDVGVCVCLSPTIDNKTVLSLLSMAPPCTIVVNLRNVTEVYNLWPHPLSYLDSRRSKRDNNHTDYQHCAMAAQTSVLLALVCFVFFILVKGKSVSVLTLTLGFD